MSDFSESAERARYRDAAVATGAQDAARRPNSRCGRASAATLPALPPQRKRPFGRWFTETGWRHIVGVVVLVFAIFPIVFVLSASLNPHRHAHRLERPVLGVRLRELRAHPQQPADPVPAWFANTLIIAAITCVLTVFLGALAAYSFSRMRFTGRRIGLISIVVVQMFPQMLAVVAIFLLLSTDRRLLPGARPRLAGSA